MFYLQENKEGLELLKTAIAKAGYTGKVASSFAESDLSTEYMADEYLFLQVVIGMDVAASEFYDNKDKTYDLNFKEEVYKFKLPP